MHRLVSYTKWRKALKTPNKSIPLLSFHLFFFLGTCGPEFFFVFLLYGYLFFFKFIFNKTISNNDSFSFITLRYMNTSKLKYFLRNTTYIEPYMLVMDTMKMTRNLITKKIIKLLFFITFFFFFSNTVALSITFYGRYMFYLF